MPYFEDLHELLREVTLWADLRHEQGTKVKATIKHLHKELKRARRKLRAQEPDGPALATEPNELAEIQSLRPKGPRQIWTEFRRAGLASRLKGAWLGRAAGCTLGAPVEGWPVADMEALAQRHEAAFPPDDYWPGHPQPEHKRYGADTFREYLKGHIRYIPVDDDLTYTLLGLLILEKYGPGFTYDDVGRAWVKHLPEACTAEEYALAHLRSGVPAAAAADGNPYQEWIGADIRSDPWGYAAPGWPERAAEMAYRDAYISHRQNGIYGAMFFAAAISAAFAVSEPQEALEIGLTEIPKGCRLAKDIRWAFRTAPDLRSWRAAREAVDERFKGMHSVHTNNNACLTIFGLLLGGKDFTKTIGMTVAMGLDNDCTAATAGSILGAILGARGIPEHWWKPFRNKVRTYIKGHPWFENTDVVKRFAAAAQTVWES